MLKKSFALVSLGCVFTLGLFVGPALAQVMLEQGRVSLQLRPGEKVANSINAINRSKAPLKLRVYVEDFEYTPPYRGSKEFKTAGSEKRSCANWISFSPATLQLDPEGKAAINYTINVPEKAKGGYNAVLFVENAGGDVDPNIGVKIVTRVGSLFFLDTTDAVRKATVEKMIVDKDKFAGRISNQGDLILVIKGTYFIIDTEGMAAERGEIEAMYLPPGKTAGFNFVLPGKLAAGKFTMVLTFDLGEGVSSVTEVDFSKDKSGAVKILATRS